MKPKIRMLDGMWLVEVPARIPTPSGLWVFDWVVSFDRALAALARYYARL